MDAIVSSSSYGVDVDRVGRPSSRSLSTVDWSTSVASKSRPSTAEFGDEASDDGPEVSWRSAAVMVSCPQGGVGGKSSGEPTKTSAG